MTDQTKTTTVQVTYTLQGSFEQGYQIERSESNGLTVQERLACLFADLRTVHKALVNAAVAVGRKSIEEAELDAGIVIAELVGKTLDHPQSDELEVEELPTTH